MVAPCWGSLVSAQRCLIKVILKCTIYNNRSVYIVQNNMVLVYSTSSGLLTGKLSTPTADSIANIVHLKDPSNILLVFTSNGKLLDFEMNSSSSTAAFTLVRTREINLSPRNWIPILSVTNFIWPNSNRLDAMYFYIVGYPQDGTLPTLFGVPNQEPNNLYLKTLCKEIVPNLHSVASGMNGRFVAAVQPDSLFVKDVTTKTCRWHKSGGRKFTCVAAHPTEWVCATGDETGRIIVWSNSLQESNSCPVAKSVFHWHSLPLVDLCFSVDGKARRNNCDIHILTKNILMTRNVW
jgi:hypothetical protein